MERRVDVMATAGALAVIPAVLVEGLVGDPRALTAALWANWLIWIVFVADATVKVRVRGAGWLAKPEGVLEAAIIVVSFPALGSLLAGTRLLRLARLTRVSRATRLLRLARLALVPARGILGLQRILDPAALPFVTALVVLIVVTGGAALYLTELSATGMSVADAVWWAFVTVTTVGYGDISPATGSGRIVAVIVMIVGITFTSLLTAQIAAYLTQRNQSVIEDDLRGDIAALSRKVDALGARLAGSGSGDGLAPAADEPE